MRQVLAIHQLLVEHTDAGPLLIFPSLYRRERQELVRHPSVPVSYRLNGFLNDVYATLMVKLHHVKPFLPDMLWRYAIDFKTLTARPLGKKLTRRADGAGELEIHFDPTIRRFSADRIRTDDGGLLTVVVMPPAEIVVMVALFLRAALLWSPDDGLVDALFRALLF